MVGEGADSQIIWDRIRKHQLEYQVILPGSFDEVTDVLRAADAFVLPSYQEGMSLSLLEAMSMRLPVIASDIPANQELIREANGKTFPVRNAQALSEVLLQVLKDRTEANQFADNAFQFVSENYSVERMAESHFDVIEKSIQLSVRS